jgi:tRNA(Ile2) C34 agmatinyltransferase TiaS
METFKKEGEKEMKILGKPKCDRCGEQAICLIHHKWVCSKCLIELNEKLKIKREKEFMEVWG